MFFVNDEKQIKKDISNKYTNGVLSYIINETTSSGSLVFAILNGINKVVFEGKIGSAVTIFLSSIVFGKPKTALSQTLQDLLIYYWQTQNSIEHYFFFQILIRQGYCPIAITTIGSWSKK